MRVVVLSLGLLAVMGLVTGCSSECESVCAEANACSVGERPADVDCPHFCADAEAFNTRSNDAGHGSCAAQFEAHLNCWSQNTEQICKSEFEGCDETAQAWVDCMTPYCAALNAEQKTDPNCFRGRPTLLPF